MWDRDLSMRARWVAIFALVAVASGCRSAASPPRHPLLTSPSFIALRVGDVDAASRWYRDVFALTEVRRLAAEDGRYTIVLLSGGSLSVELIEQPDVERPPTRHLGHFKTGLFVSDIEALHAFLRERGVDVDDDVFFDGALNARSFVFRDNEGNRLQAFQRCSGGC